MKTIRYLLVAAVLGCGFVTCAQAHVFVGTGFSAPRVSGHAGRAYDRRSACLCCTAARVLSPTSGRGRLLRASL
jgi:hypothetical protein